MAEGFYKRWHSLPAEALVKDVLQDTHLWGRDLSSLPGFLEAVTEKLNSLQTAGVKQTAEATLSKKVLIA
jgi:tagaturonate reductase